MKFEIGKFYFKKQFYESFEEKMQKLEVLGTQHASELIPREHPLVDGRQSEGVSVFGTR